MDDDVGLDYHLWFSRQYNELWEIIWLKKRIELLKVLQRKHKNLEIDFLKARGELKEQYKGFFKNLQVEAKTEFWLAKLKSNEELAKKITQSDEEVFRHLNNIFCRKTPNGFKLAFLFNFNPYFKDSKLTKTFQTTSHNKPKVIEATGMEIQWYPGKSLTDENGNSFFNFFKSPVADTADEVQRLMEEDYSIGSTIRDKVIKNRDLKFLSPVSYKAYKHDMLRMKYTETIENLEAKFLKLYKPLYAKRSRIVNNIVKDEVAMNHGVYKVIKLAKEIPNFWLSAMKNHEVLAQEITQPDEEALKYLKDIKWFKIDGPSFRLEFVFQKPNPYFENDVLTKTYHQPVIKKTTGCVIKWHHEKDLTRTLMEGILIKKSQRMTKTRESFFNFFDPPKLRPEDDHRFDRHSEFYDEYLFQEVKSRLRYDYYIGKIFRDKIIPHAISWFTREALEEGGEFEVLEVPTEYADDVDFRENFLKI